MKQTLWATVTLATLVLFFSGCADYLQDKSARPPAANEAIDPVGRFQIYQTPEGTLLLDTATGDVWRPRPIPPPGFELDQVLAWVLMEKEPSETSGEAQPGILYEVGPDGKLRPVGTLGDPLGLFPERITTTPDDKLYRRDEDGNYVEVPVQVWEDGPDGNPRKREDPQR